MVMNRLTITMAETSKNLLEPTLFANQLISS
jgi:hypothetical protein